MALSTDKHGIVLEPSVRMKQLTNAAIVHVDPHIPLRRYFRSGQELLRMAVIYHEEKNLENAYMLYMKYMVLFLEKIANHPEYPTYPNDQKAKNKKQCMSLLTLAEEIKATLMTRYQKQYDAFVEQQRKMEEELQRKKEKEEMERRLEEEEKAEEERRRRKDFEEDHDLQRAMLESLNSSAIPSAPPAYHDHRRLSKSDSLYPTSDSFDEDHDPDYAPNAPTDDILPSYSEATRGTAPLPPARALKPIYDSDSSSSAISPQRDAAGGSHPPTFDRSAKPTSLLGGGSGGIRMVRVPRSLVPKFMSLAEKNTALNTETCGVLAGSMRKGELIITHLLVPQQTGTADSCTTHQEEQLFNVQDKHEIITLGWIHTHPSQTAFLSSVDLHTHCSYQLMMPEAIAIVCAPKHKENAVFTLTPDYGLNYIASCRQTGFHPHPNFPELYKKAEHVIMDDSGDVTVIDLR